MKTKIIVSLCTLFLIFASGATIAALNIRINAELFEKIVKLQQIQSLRQNLVQSVLKVQSGLYAVDGQSDLDSIVESVNTLDETSRKCLSCHHQTETSLRLNEIQQTLDEFKKALSFYITASANSERVDLLKREASLLGNRLLSLSERLSSEATVRIERTVNEGFTRLQKARILLFSVLGISCILGIAIAVHLTRSITLPIHDMLNATRRIASGELGYAITHPYAAEFGELADNFNSMSASLKNGYSVLQKEVQERKQTERALRESEERYALAAQGANDGLWDWDLRRGEVYFSARWKSMLGFDPLEIGSQSSEWLGRVHPEERDRLEAKIAALQDGSTPHLEDEYRMRHRDGSWRWMLTRGMAVRDSSGAAYRMAGSQTDITERKMAEEQLLHDAFHDALTGLPNRALFMNRLKHVIAVSQRREDHLFGVLFLDLDRFKVLNDSLGHLVGDQILISVGKRLTEFVRPSDTVARLGGDEFAILLEDIGNEDIAVQIARRIKEELPRPIEIGGHEVFTSTSIGIAFGRKDYARPEQILRDADLAMYHAKAKGKDRYETFDRSMQDSTVRRLQLETDLRRAVERQEFRLHYQPILCLETGHLSGFESLLRWEHPTRGLTRPLEFIPMAEETGLITPIGHWALREVCRQAEVWRKRTTPADSFTMNVNLSSREFTPVLLQVLREIAAEAGTDLSYLRIEITERTIMENPQSAAKLLLELKGLGIGIQIDDFGTGYSSLSYLHQFPIDALKIDRSFISMIDRDREKFEIVKAIVHLARNLNMSVIAEGVQRTEELQVVSDLGCGYIQGYLISRPVDPGAVEHLLDRRHSMLSRHQG